MQHNCLYIKLLQDISLFPDLGITNKAAMNIHGQILIKHKLSFSWINSYTISQEKDIKVYISKRKQSNNLYL